MKKTKLFTLLVIAMSCTLLFAQTTIQGLPPGLSLDSTTGVLSGTIPAATNGTYQYTVVASDVSNPLNKGTAQITMTVVAGVIITTTVVPNGVAGQAYQFQFNATGGSTKFAWSVLTSGGAGGTTTVSPTH